jgi:hypothetical protein
VGGGVLFVEEGGAGVAGEDDLFASVEDGEEGSGVVCGVVETECPAGSGGSGEAGGERKGTGAEWGKGEEGAVGSPSDGGVGRASRGEDGKEGERGGRRGGRRERTYRTYTTYMTYKTYSGCGCGRRLVFSGGFGGGGVCHDFAAD